MSGKDPRFPFSAPIYPPGKEPLPPGLTKQDREAVLETRMLHNRSSILTESAPFKSAMAGAVFIKLVIPAHLVMKILYCASKSLRAHRKSTASSSK
ncbi:hypothetical protein CPB85DRAFT_1564868 [Mucidula mucida]|nr:hypothetical protein CPB85DRAFT_1564868 [Mucidula mucida]